MDIKKFNELMQKPPGQGIFEWRTFLEFIEAYFKNRGIEEPIIVEIGTRRNRQKAFYKELFNAIHIGIDKSVAFATPDILGDSHDKKTLEALKALLNEMPINLLFIDGDHTYGGVKKDYEMYAPLVENIIALHDISSPKHGVWMFWDELNKENNGTKRTVQIGQATGLIFPEGEKNIYEKYSHKGRYYL